MDDFVILVPNKEKAKEIFNLISVFLHDRLNLQLNDKSKYFLSKAGIDFCGYKIFETHILLRKRYKKKMKKKFKLWKKLIANDKFCYEKFIKSVNSCKGHASHANSYNFISKLDKDIECLNVKDKK